MTTSPNRLFTGDPAPHFRAPTLDGNAAFSFDTAAGRHILMLFYTSAADPAASAALDAMTKRRELFDDRKGCFFGIGLDPADGPAGRIRKMIPGIRHVLDHDGAVSRLYGAAGTADQAFHDPFWLILDPGLRVVARLPIEAAQQALDTFAACVAMPEPEQWAPVLSIPNVLEPRLCRQLIASYDAGAAEESGFMREKDGKTVYVVDPQHKRRTDHILEDESVRQALRARVKRRIAGPLHQAFQFTVTRMERYIVARYDADHGGHFGAHRDNTTKGTAHRRFAVTINLNAGDYDGGDLRFPEFGSRLYRAPTGGAIIFSCSLLHEVVPITRGRRYACLPFLYDDQAAALRERNNPYLDEGIGAYVAG